MIRVTQEELKVLLEAAERVARRTHSRFVIRWDRIEIVDNN